MIARAIKAERSRGGSADAFAPAGYQQQRIEQVACMLCGLDGVEPYGPTWGVLVREATRFVAAAHALQLHAGAVANARHDRTTEH